MRTLKNLKEEEAETYQLTDESYVIIGSEPAAMTDRVVYTPFIYCDMHSGLIINLNHKSPVETQHPHQFEINPYLLLSGLTSVLIGFSRTSDRGATGDWCRCLPRHHIGQISRPGLNIYDCDKNCEDKRIEAYVYITIACCTSILIQQTHMTRQ